MPIDMNNAQTLFASLVAARAAQDQCDAAYATANDALNANSAQIITLQQAAPGLNDSLTMANASKLAADQTESDAFAALKAFFDAGQ